MSGYAHPEVIVDTHWVAEHLHAPNVRIVEVGYDLSNYNSGHIPGAVNHHYQRNVNAAGTFLPREELRRQLAATLGGRPASSAILYCGSGVTACHLLLALEHAGLGEARLYAGSWSEWSSDETRPAASGEEPTGVQVLARDEERTGGE